MTLCGALLDRLLHQTCMLDLKRVRYRRRGELPTEAPAMSRSAYQVFSRPHDGLTCLTS